MYASRINYQLTVTRNVEWSFEYKIETIAEIERITNASVKILSIVSNDIMNVITKEGGACSNKYSLYICNLSIYNATYHSAIYLSTWRLSGVTASCDHPERGTLFV